MKKIIYVLLLTLIINAIPCYAISISNSDICLYENPNYTMTNIDKTAKKVSITVLQNNNYLIMLAQYDDNKLLSCTEITENSNYYPLETTADAVKVFVWENFQNVKPVCSLYNQNHSCSHSNDESKHQLVYDIVTKEPTCKETGLVTARHCSECGMCFENEITLNALGHIEVIDIKIPETCTQMGFTEGIHCSRCNEIIKAQIAIPASGHTPSGEANCIQEQICTVCNEILTEKTEHTFDNHVCTVCGYINSTPTEGLKYQKYGKGDGTYYYEVTGIENVIDTDIVIPSIYDGIPVEAIGYRAFRNNAEITSVFLPNTIECIDTAAFENCYNLKSINIPINIKEINGYAFDGCYKLGSSITIPSSATYIGSYAFWESDIEKVTIQSSDTQVNSKAFANCSSLTEITVPSNLIITETDSVFSGSENIKTINYNGTCLQWKDGNGRTDIEIINCTSSIKPTDHYTVVTPSVEPTCTDTGLTEGAHCDVCKKVMVKQNTILANGHQYENGICLICGDNIADYAGGIGTEEKPYLISTVEHLGNVGKYEDSYYKIISDIDLKNSECDKSIIYSFEGVLDGDNHSIYNMKITHNSYTSYAGLVGINRGIIKNISIVDSEINAIGSTTAYSGAIAGINYASIINCHNINTKVYAETNHESYQKTSYAGGIAGLNSSPGALISRCHNTGTIWSYATGNYSTKTFTAFAGGITGNNKSGLASIDDTATISDCYNCGKVSATSYVEKECSVLLNEYSGGIAGRSYGSKSSIIRTYSINSLFGYGIADNTPQYYGGVTKNSYFLAHSYPPYDGVGATRIDDVEKMKVPETFVGFDFEDVWYFDTSDGYMYPKLRQ